jgi:hypothetical protein
MATIDHNDKCPECGQRKSHHPFTGEYCLYCGWVEHLHTPGPWTVTRDPFADIPSRCVEENLNEYSFLEDWDQEHPNFAFMESLIGLHDANNDRLMEAVPELYALYCEVKRVLQVDDEHWNLIPGPAKADFRRALDRVEQTRLRHLERNVKKLMEDKS